MSHQLSSDRIRSDYLSDATIAAVITALGGPIAVVRISGTKAFEVSRKLLSSEGRAWPSEDRVLNRALLLDEQGKRLDDALVVKFTHPRSFTGEDCVEFHVHGGAFTVRRLLESLQTLGVRQALPGEFSFRAVRNGKLSLSQAESISDLITASNQTAVELALEKLDGIQNKLLATLAEDLRVLAMLGEAGIDFSDQEIDEVSLPRLKERLAQTELKLKSLASGYQRGHRIQEGISVSFVGLPNAGKSSFFNALLGEDRSIVSEVEGTTRDIVRERLTLQGTNSSITLRLEDTAGLRETEDGVERIGIERTRKSVQHADLVLWIVDVSKVDQNFNAIEVLSTQLQVNPDKTLGVLTKIDLVKPDRLEIISEQVKRLPVADWMKTSAVDGTGIQESAQLIADFCEKWVYRTPGEVLLTQMDQVRAVNSALSHLERALAATEVDLFAADIRHVLEALTPLIGETVPDDILGRIFSKFCIGK